MAHSVFTLDTTNHYNRKEIKYENYKHLLGKPYLGSLAQDVGLPSFRIPWPHVHSLSLSIGT